MSIKRNIEKELIGIIEEILNKENNYVTLNHTFAELEIDSILFIRLVVQCETKLGIQFEDEMLLISKFTEVHSFAGYIQKRYELMK